MNYLLSDVASLLSRGESDLDHYLEDVEPSKDGYTQEEVDALYATSGRAPLVAQLTSELLEHAMPALSQAIEKAVNQSLNDTGKKPESVVVFGVTLTEADYTPLIIAK
jgi:hypothetical protein|tara:strand:+ start:1150 stop:1473 length:324 start_codon:yes stop_codon:yes gene_type:complete